MGKIQVNTHLTSDPARDAIANTYIGQAHIGGTGPNGTTCRKCRYWGKDAMFNYEHFGHRKDCHTPGILKEGQCHKIWPNKVYQLFPHTAKACSFFEENTKPPVAKTKPPVIEAVAE